MQGKYTKQAQKIILEIAEGREGRYRSSGGGDHARGEVFEKGDRPLELVPTRQWYTRIMDKRRTRLSRRARRSSGTRSTW